MNRPALIALLTLATVGSFSAHSAASRPACDPTGRVMNSLFNRPAGAKRVCSGRKYIAYAAEIQQYYALGVRFEIWTATEGQAARTFDQTLKVKLRQFGYLASEALTNGDVKYNHAQGRGVRISRWTEGNSRYWMLFLY
ncbi:hypothetical protein ACFSC4_03785 [Deinococcus malanensis]|uniref:hypothetical protein n=1 Tax=Deinococcus malanensis TaxID=1706855 RepID=UPI00166D5B71|nr:hypothetical protein [Deinococcus malanensis]